jgi:hypothetical protein
MRSLTSDLSLKYPPIPLISIQHIFGYKLEFAKIFQFEAYPAQYPNMQNNLFVKQQQAHNFILVGCTLKGIVSRD